MVMGDQLGKSIISGGITGTPFHSHCPKSESHILVNTRVPGTPPLPRMNSLALRMNGSSADTPANFSAK